jgi:hypothetical protein
VKLKEDVRQSWMDNIVLQLSTTDELLNILLSANKHRRFEELVGEEDWTEFR